ncbi:hypothetical protein [Methylobacterium tarhaniae]|uniref:hypothetical protein n=1 Tax=Methylobacterium tarhaniae TaxID=1187852 RepID=UPI00069FB502|nr:hypothetical protein [Methylobacterium tarhaniae]
MATPIDTGTIVTLLRRATETVRASTARVAAAEARADRLSREVGALLGRVEEALRASSTEAVDARQAAAEAQDAAAEAEAKLSAERSRVRRLEERLAEVMADTAAARSAAVAAEAGREAAELRLARIRTALLDEAAIPPEAERPAALH